MVYSYMMLSKGENKYVQIESCLAVSHFLLSNSYGNNWLPISP